MVSALITGFHISASFKERFTAATDDFENALGRAVALFWQVEGLPAVTRG